MKQNNENDTVELKKQAFVQFLRVRERFYTDITRLLKQSGLTEPQYNVLRILRGAGPGGLPCLEIGRRMITRVPDITRLLDRLEAMGLVDRERCIKDRRVVTTVITKKGMGLLAKLDDPINQVHEDKLGKLSDRELVSIIELTNKILDQDK